MLGMHWIFFTFVSWSKSSPECLSFLTLEAKVALSGCLKYSLHAHKSWPLSFVFTTILLDPAQNFHKEEIYNCCQIYCISQLHCNQFLGTIIYGEESTRFGMNGTALCFCLCIAELKPPFSWSVAMLHVPPPLCFNPLSILFHNSSQSGIT